MGTLIKGLGADHVCWGTDALWTGAPQWQIEASLGDGQIGWDVLADPEGNEFCVFARD